MGNAREREKEGRNYPYTNTLSSRQMDRGERAKIFIAHFPLLLLLSNFAYRLPWHFQLSNLILL